MTITRTLALAVAFAISAPALAQSAKPYTIEDFARFPTFKSAKISPDGRYLAISVDRGEQDVLTVMNLSDLKIINTTQLPDKKSIAGFYWVGPNRLMFTAARKMGGYASPFLLGEWYAVNADGSQPTPVIFRGTRDATQRGKSVGYESFSMIDTLDDDDRQVLMLMRSPRSSEGANAEVVRMDTFTGRRTSIGRAPKAGCSLSLDAAKEVRFAVCSSSVGDDGEYDERTELYRRDGSEWTLVNASKTAGKHLAVIATTRDGTVYAEQDDGKTPAAIGTLDTKTGEFKQLFKDDVAEVSDYLWSSDDKTLIGVVTEAAAPHVTLLDESHPDADIYTSLSESFPGQIVDFSSATRDGDKIVVSVRGDRNPGELYLFDRKAGTARFLMKGRQWLDAKRMGSVKPFRVDTRDGKAVYGYLTLPPGSDGKNLPLIVNPHGGPIGPRDNWGFNSEAQMFASRGYAVLQMNFRGSGGYGRAFQEAGHQQWGDGIQNDIIDATQWAINEGYADKNRICIYGGSFGGYSALMAPIRAPGMFKCTFGYVGVYDIDMMHKRGDIPESESGQRFLRRTHGTDKAVWARNSPASRASEVKIPVYLAAGARDVRTPPEQTERMAEALKAAGNPPEGVIIQSGEMHGFYDVKNRINLYTKMLEFFDRHIGRPAAR
ncbi:S9 family peptidase [Lysobacter oculi]|uniref:S9 family peptidase n=1 Tax=Solilutibacter oculi TaxID=2698682 RepID=A0A344J469_9GAMM|nr:S9 family peptidase [Lysobacter oculi]AXA83829.1 S9 family peptidase [Lysobacter oculi]